VGVYIRRMELEFTKEVPDETGELVFRCRRCSGLFKQSSEALLHDLVETVLKEYGVRERSLNMHTCDDGHFGVLDVVGGEKSSST